MHRATATIQSYKGLVKHTSGAGLKNIVDDTKGKLKEDRGWENFGSGL